MLRTYSDVIARTIIGIKMDFSLHHDDNDAFAAGHVDNSNHVGNRQQQMLFGVCEGLAGNPENIRE